MILPRRIALVAVVFAALQISACGGGTSNEKPLRVAPKVPPDVLTRADAICRGFLRETEQIGKGVLADPAFNTLELTTERLVKPSIPLLERVADRQQALEPAAHDPQFDLYANLFDPIVVLAQKRLSVGRAGDYVQSKQLEEMMTDLGLEQRQAARAAGLRDCDADFQRVLLSSLSE